MTIIPSVDATARAAAAAAASKSDALRAELVAKGMLTAAGGSPPPAPTPTYATAFTTARSAFSGPVGSTIPMTATPGAGGWPSGVTLTPVVSGIAGSFAPASAQPAAGSANVVTFAFTPSAAGTASLSIAASPAMTTGAALSFTANAAATGAASTQLANFAGPAGSQPTGTSAITFRVGTANGSQLDGAGHYSLAPGSGEAMMEAQGAQPDGYTTVTLSAPGRIGFVWRGIGGAALGGYYMGVKNGNIGVYTLLNGNFESQKVDATVPCPTATTWTLGQVGNRFSLFADGAQVLAFSDAEFPAAGTIGIRLMDGATSATLVSSIAYQTPADFDAAYAAAHPPVPSANAAVQTFALSNWSSAAPSVGLARQGVFFAMGQVPAGSSTKVQRNGATVAAQFDERVTWPDGSLKFAVMHLRDTPLAANESRTYSHVLASGVPFDNAGTATLATITGAHDFKVTFNALTETNDAGSITAVGSGAFQASFNSHMAVATRREKHHSGPICEGWTGWGMATDTAGGAADGHLQVIWHGDVWKNADGSTYAVEVAGEPAQQFWSVPNKRRRNYDAALRDGGTAIASYPGVVHPYNSRWLTCQNAGGNSRGKRHWIGGAQPTLTYKPDRAYWIAFGGVPSYDLKHARNPLPIGNNANYVPCGAADQRSDVDGTGGYAGRGILPNQDVIAFCRQTPEDYAAARINAHVAMHLPMHHRSNNQRSRPGEAPDVANTPISLIMGRSGTGPALPGYDFTAQGMPAPVHAYADMRSDPATQDGYVVPEGGGGVWTWSYQDDSRPTSRAGSAAHTVNHGFLMYLHEGERYHFEALLDQATNTVHERIGNTYSARPYMIWTYGQDPIWDAIAQISDQERSFGWAINVIGSAAGIVPDAHVAAGCIKRFNRQQALYLKDYLAGMPAYWEATGLSPWQSGNSIVNAPWMLAFQGLGCYQNWRLTGDLDIKAWAMHVAKWSRNQVRDRIYMTYAYRAAFRAVDGPYDPVTNPYRLLPMWPDQPTASIAAATGILTGDAARSNGDRVYVAARDYDSHPIAVPPDLTQGVPYFVVNANVPAKTFQLATSPGGSPISFAADRTNVHFFFDDVGADTTAAATPGADSYPSIHTALVVEDYLAGAPGASLSLVGKALNFCSGNGNQVADWATWDYAPHS